MITNVSLFTNPVTDPKVTVPVVAKPSYSFEATVLAAVNAFLETVKLAPEDSTAPHVPVTMAIY